MTRLTYYPLPKPQESAMSLIFRCAKGNAFSTAELFRDASIDGKGIARTSTFWQGLGVCELLTSHEEFTVEEKAAIRSCFYKPVRHHAHGIPTYYVEIQGLTLPLPLLRQYLALCPGCARDGHLNHMHMFTVNEICPVHGERYITECPSCGKPLRWTAISDYMCPCTYDLRNTPTVEFSTQTAQLLSKAVDEKDDQFFTRLLAAIVALRFIHTVENRITIMDQCLRIATGNKSYFFREMDRIQEQFPSLHRRAILAPFMLSENATLSEYALEYLFQSSQSQPLSHSSTCQCGELSYTSKELSFIFDTHNILQTWNQGPPLKSLPLLADEPKSEQRYQCPDLCKLLYNQRSLHWDSEDLPGEPSENFSVVGLKEAAEFLDTSTTNVRALITSKLLKGHSTSHPNGWKISLVALQEFGKKYALRTEILRRSGLNGGKLNKLLAGLAPIAISAIRYGSNLLVYQRKHLSEALRLQLEKKDLAFLQSPLPADGLVIFKTVQTILNLKPKDVRALRDIGVLTTIPCIGYRGAEIERCTPEGVQRATEWRKQHLSVAELAKITGYGTRTIHMRFLDTGAVPFIKLQGFFVSVESAKFIMHHLNSYITWMNLCSATGMSASNLNGFVEKNLLTPLSPDHPDAIKGQILFKADEAREFITGYQSKRIKKLQQTKPRYATARRPELDDNLTTPKMLEVIVRTCCFSLRSGHSE
ncbi:hypothetical protein [Pseudomonas mohnii]